MNGEFLHKATRVITGEADEHEESIFLADLQESPEKMQEFRELKEAWEESKNYKRPALAENDWSKLEARIQSAPKRSGLRFSYGKIAMAASFTLITMVSWVLWVQVFSWEKITADGGNQEVLLPDMSRVVLKEGSELRYKKAFADNRSIRLKGEAWFEVTKDKLHPFRIATKFTETVVLGTAFDIREWDENGDVEIRVTEGKVSFSGGDQSLILEKGMAARFQKSGNSLENIPFGSPNNVSWKDGVLRFDNTDIHTALEDIGHYYGVKISHRLPEDYCPLSGDLGNSTKEEVLENQLRTILELEIDVQEDTWLVKNGTCRK